MKQHFFQILEAINQNNNLNQKKIADICAISIGKVNYLINNLILDGYIYSEKSGRNISYYLTQKGITVLKNGIESYQNKKVIIHKEQQTVIRQAVILAAGSRRDFPIPAGLMPIDDITLINRNIEILKENGIDHIVIVTGFNHEVFQGNSEYSNIKFVNNDKFKWTGSMASLALAQDFITDDFLLIEDDILIEERAYKEVLSHPQRDCVLITNESGSGDEAFVEIRNGYLHKISKDIHHFNQVDGEMIGFSKLSYDVYTKMVNEYKVNNKNPYMNYEYMLLDVSRYFNIGYLKMNNLIWGEVDNQQHYDMVTNKTYPILKRKEAEFREFIIKGYLTEALEIENDDIQDIQAFGGMTNKNYKVLINDKEYVLRIPGNGTEQMINRKEEMVNSSIASELGIDTDIIYFNADTGVKITELISNAETLTGKTAKRQDNMVLTTDLLRKLHNSGESMANDFNVFEKISNYENLMIEVKGQPYEHYEEVKKQVLRLKEVYQGMNITLSPCHNDLVPENLVKSGSEKLYIIDWEYAGMNDPMWDVAAISIECEFSAEEEELFLSLYLQENVIPLEIQKRVLMNKIFQDMLWTIWTIIKEAKGDDFGTYGIKRFNRLRENLKHSFIREMSYES
jgi:thiamine kinase-like enzyme/choline kinase/predicted transcriptional regulator